MNEILLEEVIEFGKMRGSTGSEALKSNSSYICWIYNNTDIPIDSRIVVQLIAQGRIKADVTRVNSKVHESIKGAANPFVIQDKETCREFADKLRSEMVRIRKEISEWGDL